MRRAVDWKRRRGKILSWRNIRRGSFLLYMRGIAFHSRRSRYINLAWGSHSCAGGEIFGWECLLLYDILRSRNLEMFLNLLLYIASIVRSSRLIQEYFGAFREASVLRSIISKCRVIVKRIYFLNGKFSQVLHIFHVVPDPDERHSHLLQSNQGEELTPEQADQNVAGQVCSALVPYLSSTCPDSS